MVQWTGTFEIIRVRDILKNKKFFDTILNQYILKNKWGAEKMDILKFLIYYLILNTWLLLHFPKCLSIRLLSKNGIQTFLNLRTYTEYTRRAIEDNWIQDGSNNGNETELYSVFRLQSLKNWTQFNRTSQIWLQDKFVVVDMRCLYYTEVIDGADN